MKDDDIFTDTEKLAEFKPTMELHWCSTKRPDINNMDFSVLSDPVLQQKWTNELGDVKWRDIPLVISQ